MLINSKYPSPFNVLISFDKIIEALKKTSLSAIEYKANYAKSLLDLIKDKPQFVNGFESLKEIKENEQLIKLVLADLFPEVLTANEIKAIAVPFLDITFNYSERFQKILADASVSFNFNIRNIDQDQFYIMNCALILNAYYNQNIDLGKPLFYDILDKNGIMKHYRILYNADFIEIYPKENNPVLSQNAINELIDNYDNIDLWKKTFPIGSWVLKGFAIVSLVDVTIESAVSNLKSNLLKPEIEKLKLKSSFEDIFKSVFKIPDLKSGFTFYDQEEETFTLPPFNDSKLSSFILFDSKPIKVDKFLAAQSFQDFIDNQKPFVIPDIIAFTKHPENYELGTHLANQSIKSFMLAPLIKDNQLLGLIELASSTTRALQAINASKLELLLPYIADTIEKKNTDLTNQLEAIIQNEYTAIHPSVYWKFKKEAKNYFQSNLSIKEYNFKEILFKEVYPLYGQIDIKGSSDNRNKAIIIDLKKQITAVIAILNSINETVSLGIIDQKKFELERFLSQLKVSFKNSFEQHIHHYLETEVHPFLKHFLSNKKATILINDYFEKLDQKTGMFYDTRKDFDETIQKINKQLSVILDTKQKQAQAIFPHYYERFKTDGVEHNLYIGASIEPTKKYNQTYLHNLRLWQLETLCEMELAHHKLKTTLPCKLDVTSLILAFSLPISIRFRMDEKRFDVDGSYNARYEVVKKRIDKACIKNTQERITQKEKITIVYSNDSEEKEYLKYIEYLQFKNVIEHGIEKLEVEDLQGVSGLKALRIKINHQDKDLLIAVETYIKTLFKDRLDSVYSYHSITHTKNVVKGVQEIGKALEIDAHNIDILTIAAWFHDAGYIEGAQNHEIKSVELALKFLKEKNISDEILQKISALILATTFNYCPQNELEKIIKDADLSHLSNKNYLSSLEQLRTEWENTMNKKYNNLDWYNLTIDFLKKHEYCTEFAQKNWQDQKITNQDLIEKKINILKNGIE